MNPIYWQYIGIFSTALAAVLLFFLLWGRRESRREKAGELAHTLKSWGFDLLATLLTAYSIGNYFGKNSVTRCLHQMIDELTEGGLPAMLKKIGWKVVEGIFLENNDDRKKLSDLLAGIKPADQVTPPAPTLPV